MVFDARQVRHAGAVHGFARQQLERLKSVCYAF